MQGAGGGVLKTITFISVHKGRRPEFPPRNARIQTCRQAMQGKIVERTWSTQRFQFYLHWHSALQVVTSNNAGLSEEINMSAKRCMSEDVSHGVSSSAVYVVVGVYFRPSDKKNNCHTNTRVNEVKSAGYEATVNYSAAGKTTTTRGISCE